MEGEVTSNAEFVSKVAAISNFEPAFPADFLRHTKIASTEGQATPTKLRLTFALPHQVIMSNTEVHPRYFLYNHVFFRCFFNAIGVSGDASMLKLGPGAG